MFLMPKFLALACAAIGLIGLAVTVIFFKINRKKAVAAIVLCCVYLAFALYYVYLVFSIVPGVMPSTGTLMTPPAPALSEKSPDTMQVVFDVDGENFVVDQDDSLEVDQNSVVKVTGVQKNGQALANLQVNVAGFTPTQAGNGTNDIGYEFSYRNMLKRFAVDDAKSVFRVEINQGKTTLGVVFLKFTQ